MANESYRRSAARSTIVKDSGPYEAVVVNNLDTRYMGALEVELLKYTSAGGTPEKSGELFTVRYLSPFYGVTPSKGLKTEDGYANTQKSYGFWAVPPDVGTKVLVIFAEGNVNFGYWIGCIQDDYMNFMLPDGRASTERTTDATPQRLKNSKLPVGEYNKLLETGELVDPTLFNKPFNKDFTGVLEVQGLIRDEARGTTTTSARREIPSMVFGWSTPGPKDKRQGNPRHEIGPDGKKANVPYNRLGGSSFVMDDGDDKFIRATHAEDGPPLYINKEAGQPGGDETIPQNELTRIRTRTGHQILLHNSEDLIYIANSRGTAWIELSSDGKIDIHAQDSISVMSDNDINFTAERDFNIEAGRNINMKATARWSDGQQYLDNKESGRIQIESEFDTNHFVGKNHKLTVKANSDVVVDLNSTNTIKKDYHLHSNSKIYQRSDGATHESSGQTWFRTSDTNINDTAGRIHFLKNAGFNSKTDGNSRTYTTGNTDLIQLGWRHESITGEVHLTSESNVRMACEADYSITVGETMDTFVVGNINTITTAGMFHNSDADINFQAGGNFHVDANPDVHLNSGTSSPASQGLDTSAALTALDAVKASNPLDAERVDKLTTVVLPYIFPGSERPVPYDSILTRAPQHEPWMHHENMNPQAFKKEETDREDPGALPVSDRVLTPDTFAKNKATVTSSQTVVNSGTGGNPSFDGGTGDGQLQNGTVPQGTANTYGGDIQVDTSRGNPNNSCDTFFVGDGQLATITTKKRGLTTQVAELFKDNFQGFIDDLEDAGYEIKSLGGYCKRQTVSGTSWSVHASGGAIDINPPNPVYNTYPNGFYSPRPANAPMTDMPPNTLELANRYGLGWGGAWNSIDDAMHFSAYKGEGGAYRFRKGFIPVGPSNERDDEVPQGEVPEDLDLNEEAVVTEEDVQNLPGNQTSDGSPNNDGINDDGDPESET